MYLRAIHLVAKILKPDVGSRWTQTLWIYETQKHEISWVIVVFVIYQKEWLFSQFLRVVLMRGGLGALVSQQMISQVLLAHLQLVIPVQRMVEKNEAKSHQMQRKLKDNNKQI
jgi:hypothetical protein